MVRIPITSFNSGEVSPEFYGRIDQQRYFTSAKTLDNFIAREIGISSARGGSLLIAEVKDSARKTLIIPFVFSEVDPYVIEVGHLYMRFYRLRGQITETAVNISGATQANPVVVTANGHGYSNGDAVGIADVAGMIELNGRPFTVANVTTNTFELSGIDGSGYAAYSSGGTVSEIYEIASPYQESDLFDANGAPKIQFAQSADFIFFSHPDFFPRQLTRTGDTSWTLSNFPATVGPFLDENTTDTTLTLSNSVATKSISAAVTSRPVEITSTAHGFSDGDIVEITGVVGMTELNDRRFSVSGATTDTFELSGEDGSAHTAYTSGGTIAKITEEIGDTGTLTASASTFTADDVGTQVLLRLSDYSDIPPWQTGETYQLGHLFHSDSLIYEVVKEGDSGADPPAHLEGERWDGPQKVEKLGDNRSISAVTKANPAVVTSTAHGFNDGDVVFISQANGMTELNGRFFTVANVLTNTFELRGEDSTSHGTYTNSGVARRRILSNTRWKFRHGGACSVNITAYNSATSVDVEIVTDAAGLHGAALKSWRKAAWSADQGYPKAVEIHENRLCWGGTAEAPLRIDLSASLNFFDYSPFFIDGSVQDDTAFFRELNSNNPIRWMRSSDKGIIVGSLGGEWLVTTSSLSDNLTPATALARRFAKNGVAPIQPAVVAEALLYLDFSSKRVQDVVFDLDVSQMKPRDLNIFAPHIFDSKAIWMAWAPEPFNVLWVGKADGTVAGLTYNRDEQIQVFGWHNHALAGTGAAVESGTVIPSPDSEVDDLWMVVKRTINGETKRYIEVLTQPQCSNVTPGCYVDSALVYDGASTNIVSGLWHLEGESVRAVVDGAMHRAVTVTDGTIILDFPGEVIHVGLYETKVMEILPIEFESETDITAQGKKKRVKKATVRLVDSRAGWVGTSAAYMDRILYDETTMDTAPALFTGDMEQVLPGGYDEQALVRLEQRDPAPFNVSAIFAII